jgi:hypothetical protein
MAGCVIERVPGFFLPESGGGTPIAQPSDFDESIIELVGPFIDLWLWAEVKQQQGSGEPLKVRDAAVYGRTIEGRPGSTVLIEAVSGQLNNKPAFVFDGTSDGLLETLWCPTTSYFCVFAIRITNAPAEMRFMGQAGNSGLTRSDFRIHQSSAEGQKVAQSGTIKAITGAGNTAQNGTDHIGWFSYNAADDTIRGGWDNVAAELEDTIPNAIDPINTVWRFGGSGSAGNFFNGKLGSVLFLNQHLHGSTEYDDIRAQLVSEIGTYYGVTIEGSVTSTPTDPEDALGEGVPEALAIAAGAPGGLAVVGEALNAPQIINSAESATTTFELKTRANVSVFPVPNFQPTTANMVVAFDVMPKGTPTEQVNNGYAWIDVCDGDFNADNNVVASCARVGVRADYVEFSSRQFNGAPIKPIVFNLGQANTTLFEAMRIDASGNVSIGGRLPDCALMVTKNAAALPAWSGTTPVVHFGGVDDTETRLVFDSFASSNANWCPSISFRRARGTAASPSAVNSGDILGRIEAGGHNGSAFAPIKGAILFSAAENWGGGANGTDFGWYLTPKGSTTVGRVAGITSGGTLFVGGAGDLATSATEGFIAIPTVNGAPSGTPNVTFAGAALSGVAYLAFDRSSNKLMIYVGGAWRGVTLT